MLVPPSLPLYLSLVNSDLHFNIRRDGLGGCGLSGGGFEQLWASARGTWGVQGGKSYYEVRVEQNIEVEPEVAESEDCPHALR